jgi:hypothetical protein
MGFQQGLSGLSAAASNLDVIGNNVANASTVGFKSSSAQFADVFATSLSGSGGRAVDAADTERRTPPQPCPRRHERLVAPTGCEVEARVGFTDDDIDVGAGEREALDESPGVIGNLRTVSATASITQRASATVITRSPTAMAT